MTDPTKADTDDDGLNDGVEDLTYAVVTGTNGSAVLDANGHVTYRAGAQRARGYHPGYVGHADGHRPPAHGL